MRRILLFILALALCAEGSPAAGQPRREDHGDLIVLHLYGSYQEMGRQQAELIGPELRAVYELQCGDRERAMARASSGMRLMDRFLLPLWSGIGPLYEESGFHDELGGIADGLGVKRRDLMRAVFTLTAGSTVFAATRSATADGRALIGRNVDWNDGGGRRRPLLVHYHPSNGDLAYLFAGWPLVGLPTVGLNEAGFALSFNFFVSEPRVGYAFPQWPHRRALQRAASVEEGIRIFEETRLRGISTFMVMADAAGEIAMVECTPDACAVFRPEGDWFGQANHARTEAMIPHDGYRSPDSFERRAAMESAVQPHLGRLTPEVAAQILRDRANSRYANASTVANLAVLNATVVHPAKGLLWHSTAMQPHAPFGEYLPFSPRGDAPDAPSLAADPRFEAGELRSEAEVVAEARRAAELAGAGSFAEAAALLDRLAASPESPLDPARLAWERARLRWSQGRLEEAYEILGELEAPDRPYEVRAHGLVMRAVLADRLGRREDALRLYETARTHLAEHPEFNVFGDLHQRISLGLQAQETSGPLPETPDLMLIPR